MKKLLITIVLITMSFISCKKEKEGLARFVIGDWKSQELTLETQSEGVVSPVGHFTLIVNDDDTYVLTFEGYDCGAGKYTITGNNIYLNKLISDPLWSTDPIPATFAVTWVPGETQMTWSVFASLPELVWTRQ